MKLKITLLSLAVFATLSAFAHPKKPTLLSVDVSASSVKWVGKKLTGSHNGTVALKSGRLTSNNQQISSGEFVIDMNTIKDADGNANLEGHLKSEDFFGVSKYPTATLKIKKVVTTGNKANIIANLTIKGITQGIKFTADLDWQTTGSTSTLTATTEVIKIDRTKFGIKYKSKSIFSDLGDKFIDDDFEIVVKLVAKS